MSGGKPAGRSQGLSHTRRCHRDPFPGLPGYFSEKGGITHGLTNTSTGLHALNTELTVRRKTSSDKVAAIAGNPNVGKSTLFNSLTGARQHTGNWPGKTVASAQGWCKSPSHTYVLVDIPGTYSLMAHSAEEEAARNFLCFGGADAWLWSVMRPCLERNLNLVLQILEIKKMFWSASIFWMRLSGKVSPLIRKSFRASWVSLSGDGCAGQALPGLFPPGTGPAYGKSAFLPLCNPPTVPAVEEAVSMVLPLADARIKQSDSPCCFSPRWLALRLLEGDPLISPGTHGQASACRAGCFFGGQ